MNELRKKEFLSSETVTIFRYFETPDLHFPHTSTYYDINKVLGQLPRGRKLFTADYEYPHAIYR